MNEEVSSKWNEILYLRDLVSKAIEPIRAEKQVGSSLETAVYIRVNNEERLSDILKSSIQSLASIFITSQAFIVKDAEPENTLNKLEENNYTVFVTKAFGEKCKRCWKFSETIEVNDTQKTICSDCLSALN